jgi:hypothetical protein
MVNDYQEFLNIKRYLTLQIQTLKVSLSKEKESSVENKADDKLRTQLESDLELLIQKREGIIKNLTRYRLEELHLQAQKSLAELSGPNSIVDKLMLERKKRIYSLASLPTIRKIKNLRNISLVKKIEKRTEIEKFLTNEDIFLIETILRREGVSRAAFSKYLNITVDSVKRMSDKGDNSQSIFETKEILPERKNEKNEIDTIDTKNYLNKKIANTTNQNVTTDIFLEKMNQLENKLESKLINLLESVALKIKEVEEVKEDDRKTGDVENRFENLPKNSDLHSFRCNTWIVNEMHKIAGKKKWTIKKSINIAMLLFLENYQEELEDEDEVLRNKFNNSNTNMC